MAEDRYIYAMLPDVHDPMSDLSDNIKDLSVANDETDTGPFTDDAAFVLSYYMSLTCYDVPIYGFFVSEGDKDAAGQKISFHDLYRRD